MKSVRTGNSRAFFRIVAHTPRSQAAMMTLRPGQSTGGKDNVHPRSDQWLYVISGEATATVRRRRVPLHPGVLLLIEAGETHEIINTGGEPLVTINVYAPAAYPS
jgi:mannose-6-phosphate isomerase-like protein (cupin superfamily)